MQGVLATYWPHARCTRLPLKGLSSGDWPQVWNALNADYLERQAAKEASSIIAEQVQLPALSLTCCL